MSGAHLRAALRLYLIADAGIVEPRRLPELVSRAIEGGVTTVQLRAKALTTRAQVDLARTIRARCAAAGVPFLVNDRADVAAAAQADGVHVGHVGEEDLTPEEVRAILGPDAIVGASVGGADEARRLRGASYLSAGPIFATSTKADAGRAMGSALAAAVRGATSLPLIVIGGIRAEDVPALVAAGADGVAVASAILLAPDPREAAHAFVRAFTAQGVSV